MKREKARILVVDDEEIVRDSLAEWLQEDGYSVDTAPEGKTAIERIKSEPWAVLLVDLKMPGIDGLQVLEEAKKLRPEASFIIMTAYATVDTAVQAMKLGAYDYLVKPFEPEELSMMMKKLITQQDLVRENILLKGALKEKYRFQDLLSKSQKMQTLFKVARAAAESASTILILGESGTGKEVLARAIHAESPRASGPFIAVSCAALPETLLESELFGHEKGSFTLDLLRALEERRFYRVGGTDAIHVDVRIIAATNRDLKEATDLGHFREDLYYRLNVIAVTLPPLRDRKEDIPLLVEHFLEVLGLETAKQLEGVSPETTDLLMTYHWPGNVRELRNVLERGAVLAKGSTLEAEDLGLSIAEGAGAEEGLGSLRVMERRHVLKVLKEHNWNITRSARALGIDRVTLYHKIKKYELKREEKC
jgi:DNA-binding NtrC family response regulator